MFKNRYLVMVGLMALASAGLQAAQQQNAPLEIIRVALDQFQVQEIQRQQALEAAQALAAQRLLALGQAQRERDEARDSRDSTVKCGIALVVGLGVGVVAYVLLKDKLQTISSTDTGSRSKEFPATGTSTDTGSLFKALAAGFKALAAAGTSLVGKKVDNFFAPAAEYYADGMVPF